MSRYLIAIEGEDVYRHAMTPVDPTEPYPRQWAPVGDWSWWTRLWVETVARPALTNSTPGVTRFWHWGDEPERDANRNRLLGARGIIGVLGHRSELPAATLFGSPVWLWSGRDRDGCWT